MSPATGSIYEPLDETRNEVRFLEILPSDPSSSNIVHCSLKVYSLKDDPDYTALSYVWGDARVTRPVVVNGHTIEVTSNLADALLRLQNGRAQKLWVDALCINQKDDEEKSHQVQQMCDIYKNAKEVVAWLNPGNMDTKRCVEAMRKLAQVADAANIRHIGTPNLESLPQSLLEDVVARVRKHLLASSFADGDLGVVVSMVENAYWKRVWILQEISLAKSSTLIYGPDEMAWSDVRKGWAVLWWLRGFHLTAHLFRFEDYRTTLDMLYRPYIASDWRTPPAAWLSTYVQLQISPSFLTVLYATCNDTTLDCLDPRDRFYALLGFFPNEHRTRLLIDYSSSYADVFVQATTHMLQQDGLFVLAYSGLAGQICETRDAQFPSWVVDWRCTHPRGEGLLSFLRMNEAACEIRVTKSGELAIKAARVAEVIGVVPYTRDLSHIIQSFERIRSQLGMKHAEGADVSLPSLNTMIWRTLMYGDKSILAEDIEALFEKIIQTCGRQRPRSVPPATKTVFEQKDQIAPGIDTNIGLSEHFEELLEKKSPRNLFITAEGIIGSGPPITQVGDIVHAIPGLGVPVLLRIDDNCKGRQRYKLVGLAYVDNMMKLKAGWWDMAEFWATEREVREVILS
ncbi:hypothetical protein E8E13_010645 [Curvularia kusanoi]|uniref:Heterokaryon incompatibility domain-containing protein n=1 Tax=Curvularia kusanoi TaxID=90978 RepID=A0A9P4TLI1_CURKU|nr:hypothetical protein E8E13_010645 [Curvularia kusanoi]